MDKIYLLTAFYVIYIAGGLFATLAGFGVITPFKNHPNRRAEIDRHRFYYRWGGLLLIAYGIYRLLITMGKA